MHIVGSETEKRRALLKRKVLMKSMRKTDLVALRLTLQVLSY